MKLICILLLCLFYLTGSSLAEELDKKIGQMLMVGFRGLEVNDQSTIKRDIVNYHIGSVILFDYDVSSKDSLRNIQSATQVKKLIHDLQSLASTKLIISIDQEGGQVSRLKEKFGFPPTLSAQQLGESKDYDKTYHYGLTTAKILSELGIIVIPL